MRKAIFVGSFDPFTVGHEAILRRALPLFDSITIGVGYNEHKKYMQTAEERVETIKSLYSSEPRISVKKYTCLTVDFAQQEGADYIIKGVRSVKDFEYEREQADINKRIGNVETIFLMADAEMASISSTMVRELMHFGKDVSEFLPKNK